MTPPLDAIELYWIPLGAGTGGRCVRLSGRVFEAVDAWRRHRKRCQLFHSALVVHSGGQRFTIEMAPEWTGGSADHGVVARGPVGSRLLGRSRLFRYEVRCWPNGTIADIAAATTAFEVVTDPERVRRLLAIAGDFPTYTWGRDERQLGEMWNSNSLVSWLLANSGHDLAPVQCPAGGRAPGWSAGLAEIRSGG